MGKTSITKYFVFPKASAKALKLKGEYFEKVQLASPASYQLGEVFAYKQCTIEMSPL